MLVGCSDAENTKTQQNTAIEKTSKNDSNNEQLAPNAAIFTGCYSIYQDMPSQIKVSQQNSGLVMQMKEPRSAGRVWDGPEPLEILPLAQVPDYFSIDTDKVTHMVGRSDNMLVIAHVDSTYVNINPLLDSEYLAFILKGANTIYKVACDDVYSDETL